MKPTGNLVVDTICRTTEVGLTITGVANTGTIIIIDAASVAVSNTCSECGHPGKLRDHILRRLVDLPVVGFPSRLDIRVPRFPCTATSCPRKIFQTFLARADDGSKLTHRVTRWTLQRLAIDRMSVSAAAKAFGTDWDLVNQVILDVRRQLIYDDLHHLDGMRTPDVDEYVWKHTRKPGQPPNLATTLVDLTPLVDGYGPARLLDLYSGRSVEVLCTWPQERDPSFRSQVQVVATDGLTGYVSAIDQVLPDVTGVMDPFHVVHLAADKLAGCRQRLQRGITGRRGRKDDPLYKYRRILLTRMNYLIQWQRQRFDLLQATDDDYVAPEVTRLFYQDMIAACGHLKKSEGEKLTSRVINSLRKGLPAGLEELAQLGHTLWRRREDVLAYFDIGASSGPVEFINGRLEHLCGIVLGSRSLNHYILRCLIRFGQLQGKINVLQKRKSRQRLKNRKTRSRRKLGRYTQQNA